MSIEFEDEIDLGAIHEERAARDTDLLPKRWHRMRPHVVQQMYYKSKHRFNTVPAGRRSGKTELAKRRLVRRACRGTDFDHPMYFYGAPTRDQAKRIAWEDLKRLVPPDARLEGRRGKISESNLTIPLWHGGAIVVVGMDKPQRIEGTPWDGGVLDEYANMKPEAWTANVRPALSDRNGWCDLIGVPEGRNHYYDLDQKAQADLKQFGQTSEWGRFHWVSADILDAAEIAAARRDLDPLTFAQEYEASFVNFEGRAYYAFTDANKVPVRKLYNPKAPLLIMLDFNVQPGVAAIGQEVRLPSGVPGTAILGEVWIDNNSNTPAVCRRILTEWGPHEGIVEVYGDPSGGQRKSSAITGSDWDLVKEWLTKGDPLAGLPGFGPRMFIYHHAANPSERGRLNAVNSRTKTMNGLIRLNVDPIYCPRLCRDMDGVRLLKGGSGEIDKKATPMLTHISDALGYYIEYRFPVAHTSTVGFSTLSA